MNGHVVNVYGGSAACTNCGWRGNGALDALMHSATTQGRTTMTTIDTTARYQVDGHAGVWAYAGPAVVITDDDTFEHDGYVLMRQLADPDNVVVVGPDEVTAFDTPPLAVSA